MPRLSCHQVSESQDHQETPYRQLTILGHSGHANQAILGDAAALNLSSTDYNAHLRHMRDVAFKKGVNRVLEQHDLDVIIRPADSGLSSFAAAAGLSSSFVRRIPF